MMGQKRGDTIVEVMLAIALLSAVLFTSWGIVNKSTQIGLTARQRIGAVSQMREQAEIIQSKRGDLNAIIQGLTPSDPNTLTNTSTCTDAQLSTANPPDSLQRFYYSINASTGVVQRQAGKFSTTSQFGRTARVWVQYVPVPSAVSPQYIDFYVRGCWITAGGQQSEDNSQFILRLNI